MTQLGAWRADERGVPGSASMLACSFALVSLTGCGRLPVLAIGGRMRVVTHEHAAAQSLALIVGCGFALERAPVLRAEPSEPPPSVPAEVDAHAARCTDAALCRWQQVAELGAAQLLLPLAEEEERP